jgi:hypothetical protein
MSIGVADKNGEHCHVQQPHRIRRRHVPARHLEHVTQSRTGDPSLIRFVFGGRGFAECLAVILLVKATPSATDVRAVVSSGKQEGTFTGPASRAKVLAGFIPLLGPMAFTLSWLSSSRSRHSLPSIVTSFCRAGSDSCVNPRRHGPARSSDHGNPLGRRSGFALGSIHLLSIIKPEAQERDSVFLKMWLWCNL